MAKDRPASAPPTRPALSDFRQAWDFKASEDGHGETASDQGDKKSRHHCLRHAETPQLPVTRTRRFGDKVCNPQKAEKIGVLIF